MGVEDALPAQVLSLERALRYFQSPRLPAFSNPFPPELRGLRSGIGGSEGAGWPTFRNGSAAANSRRSGITTETASCRREKSGALGGSIQPSQKQQGVVGAFHQVKPLRQRGAVEQSPLVWRTAEARAMPKRGIAKNSVDRKRDVAAIGTRRVWSRGLLVSSQCFQLPAARGHKPTGKAQSSTLLLHQAAHRSLQRNLQVLKLRWARQDHPT